jgi:3-methyladenine DNA glycosylase/8-oxoguanine DNA glycosylase
LAKQPMKRALAHLAGTDPRFAALIARARPFDVVARPLARPFDALAESIAYQQLSGKAAATIFGRVRALYPKRKWLDPKLVLATPDETFRACGLSRGKTAALKDLAAKTLDGTVPSGRALARMSDEEIIERLTAVRGIGRWKCCSSSSSAGSMSGPWRTTASRRVLRKPLAAENCRRRNSF